MIWKNINVEHLCYLIAKFIKTNQIESFSSMQNKKVNANL